MFVDVTDKKGLGGREEGKTIVECVFLIVDCFKWLPRS
jgi:hypothetical protein